MLDYVAASNCNAVFVEVRKRGDAYYTSSLAPTGINITPQPGYDCLADVVTKAHARGIEVHAWVVVYRVWTTATPPATTTPNHVFNTHPEWFNLTDAGSMFGSDNNSYLDPGHPEVENHLRDVFMEIINNYDIDGFCLDYIRYPGTNWGYNPTSVARYNAEYGLSGQPSSSNTQWSNWRRDQVTNLVKRIYLEAKAVKPNIKMGAAIWNSSTTGKNSYFQDWDLWMSKHYLDYGSPMAYTTTNSTFNGWVNNYYNQQYGRHIYVSQGSYLNTISNSMTQIAYARNKPLPGVNPYSYRVTNSGTVDRAGFQAALISGPFSTPQAAPAMTWISSPAVGHLKGFVRDGAGNPVYPATVTVSTQSTKNSGTGFYGFVDLAPNTYTVTASAPGYTDAQGQVTITAGQVTTLDLTLGSDTTPPVISNVRTANVQATNAQILWDTDEAATSRVEYGLTTSYGSATTEDSALVTAHTVQLTGLTANTVYHYRVISKDGANNESVSGDYTFTTASGDTVADIIIDNPACTLYGAWTTASSSTDKYGSDYYYASTAASETKWARWTPNILTAGNYDTYCWYPQGANRSAAAPYTVYWDGGSQTVTVNQQTGGGSWRALLTGKPFAVGTAGYIKLGNGTGESSLVVMADAVKFVYAGGGGGDTTPPVISGVSSSTGPGSVTINWTTNEASTSQVEYGRTTSYGTLTPLNSNLVTSHTVNITGLSRKTTYNYRVRSKDAAENEAISGNYTFKTK